MTESNERRPSAEVTPPAVTNSQSITATPEPEPQDDRAAIVASVKLFVPEGGVTELRMINVMRGRFSLGTVAGFFNDPEMLADAVLEYAPGARGVYVIPNAVHDALLARAANRVVERVEKDFCTKDHEVTRRRWLLIDLDPKRPAGIPSSDAEHALALDRARLLRDWLTSQGWPAPILADSGNGAHLLYRIDQPPNDEGRVENCLKALAGRFNDPKVEIDVKVANPARIWKLYGTVARKGDSIPGRPRRLSRLIDVPSPIKEATP